ncbi:uncharacterized protein BX663DRAFT_244246 [Cokeromyces recurvatus]|uniref:uncharacterized protein n=1 Tax=Cokeromyces recurvatus TaxID=90255 RepID=UPI00221E4237|nr:uncharacterized protein BX663DRAFT_244246 [Cokeromyces recurvatus]KAI7905885.1 hypothetical protein BX663DRAFT_244246 [Cokeromyces recurvatus]
MCDIIRGRITKKADHKIYYDYIFFNLFFILFSSSSFIIIYKMAKEPSKRTTSKKPSPYNVFMKTEISKVKKENPGMSHKDVSIC